MSLALTAVLLTEAGDEIGLGHLTRCVALADALLGRGVAVSLVVAGNVPEAVICDRQVIIGGWRSTEAVHRFLDGADMVVIDSYTANPDVYNSVSVSAVRSAFFDDTARIPYPSGLIINGALVAPAYARDNSLRDSLLLGPSYQVVRQEFTADSDRQYAEKVQRVLIVSGGTDVGSLRHSMERAASQTWPDADIDSVTARRTASAMAQAMKQCDVAVSAAGQTLYELAATATPTVAVVAAENQRRHATALADAGAVVLIDALGEPEMQNMLHRALLDVRAKATRERLGRRASSLVDHNGAQRIARRLIADVIDSEAEAALATPRDEAELLALENDSVVRDSAFTTHTISADEHHDWFTRQLSNPATTIVLFRHRGQVAGYVRLERESSDVEVSIALAQDYRGRGLGRMWLERGIDEYRSRCVGPFKLVARIRPENLSSRALFEKAGFHCAEGQPGVEMHRSEPCPKSLGELQ